MPANAVSTFDAINDGTSLIVTITTFLPAVPTLLVFCCGYRLIPKTRIRGGQEVPHGNLLYLDCTPQQFDPTGGDGITGFTWTVPNTVYLPCDDCHLAVVEFGLAHPLDWTTQVHPCPPVPGGAVLMVDGGYFNDAAPPAGASSLLSYSYWYLQHDPSDTGEVWTFEVEAIGLPFGLLTSDNAATPYALFANEQYEHTMPPPDPGRLELVVDTGQVVGVWHHVLVSIDTSGDGPDAKAWAIYIDDVQQTVDPLGGGYVNTGAGFTINSMGAPWQALGDDLSPFDCQLAIANFWWAYGQTLLSGNTIPEATRRKFISATLAPVDLGLDGALPTGTRPTYFGRPPASSFLQPNPGTGDTPALLGVLADVLGPTTAGQP